MISKLPTRRSSKVILLEKQQWVAIVTRKSWDWTGEDPFLTGHCLIDPQTHPTGSLYFAESAQYIFTHGKKSSWQPLNLNNFLNNGYLKMIVLVWSIILLFKFAQLEMVHSLRTGSNGVLKVMTSQKLIFEIMGFVGIFWKKNIWKTYLPKTSIVGQIVLEILVPFCSDDFIQILSNLIWFLILWTETNLEGFVWNHQSITGLLSQRQFALEC